MTSDDRPSIDRPSITRIQREARRLDVATSIPQHVLAPLLSDVARRRGDDAIVIIDGAERPSLLPQADLSSAMVAVVRRAVLDEALGHTVLALQNQRRGHVPFVVIDRHGTTVVFIEMGPAITSPGGSA